MHKGGTHPLQPYPLSVTLSYVNSGILNATGLPGGSEVVRNSTLPSLSSGPSLSPELDGQAGTGLNEDSGNEVCLAVDHGARLTASEASV